jgi:hypothetical protein
LFFWVLNKYTRKQVFTGMDLERRARAQLEVNKQLAALKQLMDQAALSFRSLAIEHDRLDRTKTLGIISAYSHGIAMIVGLIHPVIGFSGIVLCTSFDLYLWRVEAKQYEKRICMDRPTEITDSQYLTFEDRKKLAINQTKITNFLSELLKKYPTKSTKIDLNVPTLVYL